jgi:hypothetical protein
MVNGQLSQKMMVLDGPLRQSTSRVGEVLCVHKEGAGGMPAAEKPKECSTE